MSIKKYMFMDLIILNVLLVITIFLSKFLYIKLDSRIYFSLGLLLQGIIIRRWRHVGIFSNLFSALIVTMLFKVFLNETFIYNVLIGFVLIGFSFTTLLIHKRRNTNKSIFLNLIFYCMLVITNGLAQSIVKSILFKHFFLDLFKEYIFVNSLTMFVTTILIFLLNNHQNLYFDQYSKYKKVIETK